MSKIYIPIIHILTFSLFVQYFSGIESIFLNGCLYCIGIMIAEFLFPENKKKLVNKKSKRG